MKNGAGNEVSEPLASLVAEKYQVLYLLKKRGIIYDKRFLSAAVALALTAGISGTALAAEGSLADVPKNHWSYAAIDMLVQDGIIEGNPDGTFEGGRAADGISVDTEFTEGWNAKAFYLRPRQGDLVTMAKGSSITIAGLNVTGKLGHAVETSLTYAHNTESENAAGVSEQGMSSMWAAEAKAQVAKNLELLGTYTHTNADSGNTSKEVRLNYKGTDLKDAGSFGIYVTTDDLSETKSHTWKRNTGAVGIAICCCYGGGSASLGGFPPTAKQIEVMAQVIDRVATALWLTIDKNHVMTHGEAADNEDGGVGTHKPYAWWKDGYGDGDTRGDLEYLGTAESPAYRPWATDGRRVGLCSFVAVFCIALVRILSA